MFHQQPISLSQKSQNLWTPLSHALLYLFSSRLWDDTENEDSVSYAALTSGKIRRDSNGLTSFSSWFCACRWGSLAKQCSLSRHSSCSSLSIRFHPSDSQWKYSNKPTMSSQGDLGAPYPTNTTKPAPTLLWMQSVPRGKHHKAPCDVWCPLPLGYVMTKLLSISSVQCRVLCIWLSLWPQGRNSVLTDGVNRRWFKRRPLESFI